MQFNSIDFCV